ncbi:MAG: FkbM family methyltransferase [candidate division WOR-3 bacterium]
MILKIPIINSLLRNFANKFEEGSIVMIKSGFAKGMLWKRYHRYVNSYWVGIYELPVQKRIILELKKGDTFMDIGANAGFFSLIAAKAVGETGRVIAFEPLPMNVEVIKEQFELNKLNQCECIPFAVGNIIGKTEFILPKAKSGSSSPSTAYIKGIQGNKESSEHITESYIIDIITLDHFCQKYNVFPDLIKIDVEGAESDVLKGASLLLRSDKAPRIIMELHEGTSNAIQNQLKNYGYRFFTLQGKPIDNILNLRYFLAYPPFIHKEPVRF